MGVGESVKNQFNHKRNRKVKFQRFAKVFVFSNENNDNKNSILNRNRKNVVKKVGDLSVETYLKFI